MQINFLSIMCLIITFSLTFTHPALSDDDVNVLKPVTSPAFADHTQAMNEGAVATGKTLPILDINHGGEISVFRDDIIKRPWSSKCLQEKGKVQVIQYVAASHKAIKQNKPFTQSLLKKQFSPEQLDTTIIVHMADTVSFAEGIVTRKLADKKETHDHVSFVLDHHGIGIERWGMKHKSFAVIILDAEGRVLFAKDGPLSEYEIESTLALIEKQMS